MKHFLATFFLIIMILNVALPLVEQLQAKDLYELVQLGADDVDDENKSENEPESKSESENEAEKDKEEYTKKTIPFSTQLLSPYHSFDLRKVKKTLFPGHQLPISELYTSLPELPPEHC